ncbi:MAG: hypothetical protein IKU34_05995 [Clostridia bacterium]|nr:hypothetical protein [Clostridia bacterium]
MIYLLLAIASSTMVSVFSRLSSGRVKNRGVMVAFNYLACSVTGFALMRTLDVFPAQPGLSSALLMGIVGGGMYLTGFLLLQWNIARNGVVLPATFQKLGVLVPTACALLIFGEIPTLLQAIGFAGAVLAILLIRGGDGERRSAGSGGLIALMLAGGSVDALGKFYEEWGNPALKNHYLFYVFFCAFVYAAILCVLKRERVTRWDALFGVLVGVPNYLCSRFLLLSLSDLPAVVVYPTFSVGTIVLVTLIGMLAFREKLVRRQVVAMGIILASLALLNM